MRKPNNRGTRIDWIIEKMGYDMASGLLKCTDKQVKAFFDIHYPVLKDAPKYEPESKPVTCLRCGEEVEIEHNHYCDCGMNKAILTEDDYEYVGDPD